MAPNRKQLAFCLGNPLVDNTQLVQPKYLPLTHTLEQATVPAPVTTDAQSFNNNGPSDDYWNWEAPEVTKEEEAPKDLFSVSSIEANLLKEAEQLKASSDVEASNDGYWAEAEQDTVVVDEANKALSQETGYWDWPEQLKDAQIAMILRDELARNRVSVDAIEKQLVQQSAQEQTRNPFCQPKAENDSYWTWEVPTTVEADSGDVNDSYWQWNTEDEEETNAAVVASILQYEANRELLSAAHVERSLASAPQPSTTCAQQASSEDSDDYWAWQAQEDDYWNMRPAPVVAQKGYWDW